MVYTRYARFCHLSIIFSCHKSFPHKSCFVWESRKMHQKLLVLEVAKRKNKMHQGWHVSTKIGLCSYNGYLSNWSDSENTFSLAGIKTWKQIYVIWNPCLTYFLYEEHCKSEWKKLRSWHALFDVSNHIHGSSSV